MNRLTRAGLLGRVLLLLVVASVVAAPGASARRSGHPVPPPSVPPVDLALQDQQRFTAWLFGSATDPLHRTGFCGEQVGDAFFLNAATTPVAEASCAVPAGVPLLALPAAAWAWAPTHGLTEPELLAARDSLLAGVSGVTVTLDGTVLDLAGSFADAGFYPIPAEPGSYLNGVTTTPENPTGLTGAVITSVGWVRRIPPLAPGPHTVELNAVFLPAAQLHARYHLTVVEPGGTGSP